MREDERERVGVRRAVLRVPVPLRRRLCIVRFNADRSGLVRYCARDRERRTTSSYRGRGSNVYVSHSSVVAFTSGTSAARTTLDLGRDIFKVRSVSIDVRHRQRSYTLFAMLGVGCIIGLGQSQWLNPAGCVDCATCFRGYCQR